MGLEGATPEELEAIQLRWRMRNPQAGESEGPTPEESLVLLGEIRQRMRLIEIESLRMVRHARHRGINRGIWVSEGTRGALASVLSYLWIGLALVSVVILINILLRGRGR